MITQEHEYYLRFILLLIQGGTEVLRCLTDKALQRNNMSLHQFLSTNQNALQNAKDLSNTQKTKLVSASLNGSDFEDFDITLLSYLITNFLKGFLDNHEMDAVESIKEMRNNSAHTPEAKMTFQTFHREWTKLIRIILTISHSLPEEKRKKLNDLIDNIENGGLDIKNAIDLLKKLDTSNDFYEFSAEQWKRLNESVCEVKTVLLDVQLMLKNQCKFQNVKAVGLPRGVLYLGADDPATVCDAESLLRQSLKDSGIKSSSQEHKELKEKVDNFVKDIKQLDITLENVHEGSVILEFKCFSLTAILNLIEYFYSSDIQVRLGEISKALEDVVGGHIKISGTLDIQSFQDVIRKTQQREQDCAVEFKMGCNCIGDLLLAFKIFEERTAPSSVIASPTSSTSGKPNTLQVSIDIGQLQQAIGSIKTFLDMHVTDDAISEQGTLKSNHMETLVSDQREETGGECSTDITEAEDDKTEDEINASNIIRPDIKASEGIAISMHEMKQTSDQTAENSEMATGRRKRRFSETLEQGSDELRDIIYHCSTCANEDRKSAAVKYCVECNGNLCLTCIDLHNRFSTMRSHRIVDFLCSEKGEDRPGMPIKECDKHVGKLINLYCSNHDVVGCALCLALDHSSCQGKINYILDIVPKTELIKEITELEIKMSQLLAQLGQLKQQKQDHIKQIQSEKDNLMKEIENLRIKINNKLDEMMKMVANHIGSKIHSKEQSVTQSIETIDNIKSSVETRYKYLQDARSINSAELFVRLKVVNSNIREQLHLLEPLMAEAELRSMKMVPSRDIRKFVTSKEEPFGRIVEICLPKYTEHVGNFNFRLETDKNTCLIYDACLTTSGHVILCDYNNKCIKKLGQEYAVTEHLELPDRPGMLCEIDSTQLAVTLYYQKKVQFVFQQPLKLGESFSVGDLCRGIDFYDEQLYVCCGGYAEEHEGSGHIEVYTLNGVLLRTYFKGLILPCYIKVLGRDEFLISEYNKRNLRIADISAQRVSEMEIESLNIAKGVCRVGDFQLCVAGWESNNIVLISQDGEEQKVLLTEDDGIVKPIAVCFNEKRSHLIIPFSGSDVVKVFRVVF